MGVEYGFAEYSEKESVSQFASQFEEVSDFAYTWNRWKNWEAGKFPVVARFEGEVVGMHAATFSVRTGYINSYYQAVQPSMQGRRVGGIMVDYVLSYGHHHAADLGREEGMDRLKMKTPKGSPGHLFWKGFGLEPYGESEGLLYWDEDIRNVASVGGLIEWMKMRQYHKPVPKKQLVRYVLSGVVLHNA